MKTAAKIFLIIATLGSFVTIEHYGYEFAQIQGCKTALRVNYGIPSNVWENLDKLADIWCQRALNDN